MSTSQKIDSEARLRQRRYARASVIVLVVGCALAFVHGIGLFDPDGLLTFPIAVVGAVVATVVGLRQWRPTPMWPWFAFGAGLVGFLVANVLRVSLNTIGDLGPSRSLFPDLIALPSYALLAVGLAGLAGLGRRNRQDVDAVLDAFIAALAVLMLAWVFLVTPVLTDTSVTVTGQILIVAYPVASSFVFAMGVRLAFGRGRRTPFAMYVYLLSLLGMLVGDVLYAMVDTSLVSIPLHLVDMPYIVALVAYAAATIHPSVRSLGRRRASDDVGQVRARLLSVSVALLLPIVLLLAKMGSTTSTDRLALGVISVLLVSVGVWRTSRALRQHAESQARLAYEATHDALTGLPNRGYIGEVVDRAMVAQADIGGSVTVLHIDIDRFKLVNDSMGHGVGDHLLLAVAERLRDRVRASDVVGRLGGDEFSVVILGLADEESALDFGERTRLMFKQAFTVGDTEITVTASVGVAFTAEGTSGAEELIRDADTAVNHAKSSGGDIVVLFDTSMRERVAERLHLERELRNALARDELLLHFQPKLRISDHKVVGLEALLRWEHPELGTVRPDKFIAIAEDTGMIVEIGAWVIDQACAELARLRSSFRSANDVCMSVNVSARQLRSDTLIDTIAHSLLRHGVPPQALCLELTESILMENLDAVSGQLDAIRSCGTRISIDDFGTGYSSLAYLSRLSVDELKIDRTFVKALGEDRNASSLIQAVVFIASSLEITTVAEGVETEAQAQQVADLGCTEVQGFLFARPVPSEELDAKLVELGMAPATHLRAVPEVARSAVGHIA